MSKSIETFGGLPQQNSLFGSLVREDNPLAEIARRASALGIDLGKKVAAAGAKRTKNADSFDRRAKEYAPFNLSEYVNAKNFDEMIARHLRNEAAAPVIASMAEQQAEQDGYEVLAAIRESIPEISEALNGVYQAQHDELFTQDETDERPSVIQARAIKRAELLSLFEMLRNASGSPIIADDHRSLIWSRYEFTPEQWEQICADGFRWVGPGVVAKYAPGQEVTTFESGDSTKVADFAISRGGVPRLEITPSDRPEVPGNQPREGKIDHSQFDGSL
ncbi:hypothetical protein [Nocardia cyriacigeorgica]|uniref:hypothetical protein n=1 Tax=Nocardia cyriacigeorgica TaxID=135487 RepID=UPI001892D500|nr:hypothetical protein [Nocardia cyriacigeorgica]MBF6412886.1 hypothetical protein [Nocardia cyriacigeorgica]